MKEVYPCEESYLYNCQAEFNVAHKTPSPHSFCIIVSLKLLFYSDPDELKYYVLTLF